ncbi:vegetative cell wall protein gp1 [Thelonectria olida]|uniref:Vegetative cell wall protein gp1 n=1 Tax=Thelonectria olida TaxID=1576542 RepID=A0A9P8WAJ8_9HYPO|nr:vegetative cell wall protein gp1 [Thelonectria olida]
MSEASPPESGHGSGNKRQRVSGLYQRKRAVAACQPCRVRKTKCDNVRPTCGFCTRHGAQCTYADSVNDHSSFDPASLAILERLNHVVSLLEKNQSQSPQDTLSSAVQAILRQPIPDPASLDATGNVDDADVDDHRLEETPNFPATTNNCEGVLKWPIFHGSVPDIDSFVNDGQDELSNGVEPRQASSVLGRGIQEEDFIPLSQRFLAYVHTKNPILDVAEFSGYVRDASETGLRWDGQSCLVLIACSIGCIATPFPPGDATDVSSTASPSLLVNKDTCQAYYLAAKKRLGLMQPSLLYIQCLFFCGVLEMNFLEPLRAWNYFNLSCVHFRNLLWRQRHTQTGSVGEVSNERRRMEQRLYWSCMKSEYELRCEIPFPASGINQFGFPNMFPSPPNELSSSPPTQDGMGNAPDIMNQDEERSWFYYLAEISFRRMMNRAFAVLGGKGEAGWIQDIQENLQHCRSFNEQLDVWCSHIPPQINLGQSERVNNELAYLVHGRAISCREWIHRPFLYYVIHQPLDDPFISQAMPLAEKCLELCVECQFRVQRFHRHHGSWYIARTSVTRALLLLAAARSKKIKLPDRWREALESATKTVEYWAAEAPDLKRAAEVLNHLM